MKALLVYPKYPDTFWSFTHALRFVKAKAIYPPLGLLTVAALLPDDWQLKLVDLNVEELTDAHLDWADAAFISAMMIQQESAGRVVERCRAKGVTTVAGGPLYTHMHAEITGVDHIVAGEAEEILPEFLEDFLQGAARPVYQAASHPRMTQSPVPRWDLLDMSAYRSMSVQFSRGCPFDCDFCDIVALFGRRPRLKEPDQVLAEMDEIYRRGWRGCVMVVDDNFIGQKARTKELLDRMIPWQEAHQYPFTLVTQASVNLADDPELLNLMARANFDQVFLGIETPASDSLLECHKHQNRNRDLELAVETIQAHGIEVMAGFIVGFDADGPSIFKDQLRFIQKSAIPTAMVGLLSVLPGTKLHKRVQEEGRLLGTTSGDSIMSVGGLNFIPKMGRAELIEGYRQVLNSLYEPRAYYRRAVRFLRRLGRNGLETPPHSGNAFSPSDLGAAMRIFWRLGFLSKGRIAFWTYLTRIGFTKPAKLVRAIRLAATGYHLRLMAEGFADSLEDKTGSHVG